MLAMKKTIINISWRFVALPGSPIPSQDTSGSDNKHYDYRRFMTRSFGSVISSIA